MKSLLTGGTDLDELLSVLSKLELVTNWLGYLAEEISKQSVWSAVWFLFAA